MSHEPTIHQSSVINKGDRVRIIIDTANNVIELKEGLKVVGNDYDISIYREGSDPILKKNVKFFTLHGSTVSAVVDNIDDIING